MKASDLASITRKVTKKWTKQRKREERASRARSYRREFMCSGRVNQSDVAEEVIPEAYAKASDNGRLPAHARQIFYAARGPIQEQTGRPLSSVYFTQTLLPQYINRNPEAADWNVVYDARGHLIEPHTDESIPLGTLEVDEYLADIRGHDGPEVKPAGLIKTEFPTKGSEHRYRAILFIEKEGFNPLFKEVKLAERFDIAIMSTKGQSVVAARRLVDELCHDSVRLLVLHDFDKEGFLISQRLTEVSAAARWSDRVRYEFQNDVNVIDLGLRLEDVEEWGLESESVRFKGKFDADTITTPEEQKFLKSGQRVELNAFTSADFIEWIEGKLEEHAIKKVVPDADTLAKAYRRAYQIAYINYRLEDINVAAAATAQAVELPDDLTTEIEDAFEADPARPWDKIIAELAGNHLDANWKENSTDDDEKAC